MHKTYTLLVALGIAALACPATAQTPLPPVPGFPSIAAMPAVPAVPAVPAARQLPSPPSARLLTAPWAFSWSDADDRADDLYDRARDLIEQGKFDRAVSDLDRLIGLKSSRTDAAIYWKAYSLSKLGQRADASPRCPICTSNSATAAGSATPGRSRWKCGRPPASRSRRRRKTTKS